MSVQARSVAQLEPAARKPLSVRIAKARPSNSCRVDQNAYKELCCSAATRCRTRNSLIRRTHFCHSRYVIGDVSKR
jgi:hypothetical protein